MNITQIASVGIIAVVLSIAIKRDNPTFSVMVGLAASVLIIVMVLPKLSAVFDLINNTAGKIQSSVPFVEPILKILGIAYISEFSSQIAADAGEGAIASKIEMGGKILIMTVSAPIIFALVNQVVYLLP